VLEKSLVTLIDHISWKINEFFEYFVGVVFLFLSDLFFHCILKRCLIVQNLVPSSVQLQHILLPLYILPHRKPTKAHISQQLNHILFLKYNILKANNRQSIPHQLISTFIPHFKGKLVILKNWLDSFVEKCQSFAENNN